MQTVTTTTFQPGATGTPASRISLSRDLRLRAVSMNHRFDKLGNPLPLELHGCGCGLCARQQRAIRQFWEAR
jgi:hypothetical protein